MSEEEFRAEKMYLLCLETAKEMLKRGIISEEEFTQIDTILLEKYKPTLSTLLSGKDLI
ncbi:MAG: SHOCT domain-containing protein [Firmicutes bacterium]|nr:SHOCT domain-containing protein [Bacillota bacterium]